MGTRVRPLGMSMALVALLALTASPRSDANAIDLDSGGLYLVPVSGFMPTVSRAEAARYFDYSNAILAQGPVTPVLGKVTTRTSRGIYSYRQAADLHDALAWVYIVYPEDAPSPSCYHRRNMPMPSPRLPEHPSKAVAFIVDAETGRAYLYGGSGFGSACHFVFLPSLSRAGMWVSVPWTYREGIWRVWRLPCTDPTTSSYGYGPMARVQLRVFIGRCSERAQWRNHVEDAEPPDPPSDPAPVGVYCGATYDPAIPKPSDCLLD